MITTMSFKAGTDPCPTVSWGGNYSNEQLQDGIEKLVSFCASKGVEVRFGTRERCSHAIGLKLITMNSRLSLKKLYHVLLHESGHVVINQDMISEEDHTEYLLNYPGNVNKNTEAYIAEGDNEHKLTKKDHRRYMVSLIHEECDAWRKGLDIAAMLELPLNLYDFYSDATTGIESYILAAAQSRS
jgi:hypothetical protein